MFITSLIKNNKNQKFIKTKINIDKKLLYYVLKYNN